MTKHRNTIIGILAIAAIYLAAPSAVSFINATLPSPAMMHVITGR